MQMRLLTVLLFIPSFIMAENIKPLTIDKAVTSGGAPARGYVVIHTVIQKDPEKAESKPLVTRDVLGNIPIAVNKTLKVPDKLTDLQGESGVNVSHITGMISQTIGTVGAQVPDPTTKTAAAAASLAVGSLGVAVEQGLRIAGKLIDKFYGKDNTLISMIEIIPDGYYTIDEKSGKVSVTKAFENDLEKFTKLQSELQPAVQAFNDAYLKYTKEYNKAQIAYDDPAVSPEEYDAMADKVANLKSSLEPLAKAKVEIVAKLANLQMYRVALMRFNLPQVGTCGGMGSGPAILRLFVFLGAKQTNLYDISYCAPNPNINLHANIEFVLPYFDNKGAYHDGGIRLVCPDGAITFQGLTASGDLAFGYPSSSVYNFYDTMLTGAAEGYEQYLVPFDINKLRADVDEEIKEAEAKKDAQEKQELTEILGQFSSAMSKAKSEGLGKVGSTVTEEIKAADEPSGSSAEVIKLSDVEEAAQKSLAAPESSTTSSKTPTEEPAPSAKPSTEKSSDIAAH